jgi:hypothetical protein
MYVPTLMELRSRSYSTSELSANEMQDMVPVFLATTMIRSCERHRAPPRERSADKKKSSRTSQDDFFFALAKTPATKSKSR